MDSHGGNVGVISSGVKGEGSTFYFEMSCYFSESGSFPPIDDSPSHATLDSIVTRQNLYVSIQKDEEEGKIEPFQIISDNDCDSDCHRERNYRALVVDDSPLNRKMMVNYIKSNFGVVLQVS